MAKKSRNHFKVSCCTIFFLKINLFFEKLALTLKIVSYCSKNWKAFWMVKNWLLQAFHEKLTFCICCNLLFNALSYNRFSILGGWNVNSTKSKLRMTEKDEEFSVFYHENDFFKMRIRMFAYIWNLIQIHCQYIFSRK